MKKLKERRGDIQFAFFVIAVLITINHSLTKVDMGISWLSEGYLHYLCPVCGVTTIYQFFASSADWLTKLLNPVSIFILISLIVAVLFGPLFCGWVCPFGAFQDFITKAFGKRVAKKKLNKVIDPKIDAILRWFRYVVLIIVVYMTAKSAFVLMDTINPYHALLNLFVGEFSLIGLIVLGVIVIASLFIYRPWCKYFCPYGALLGIFNLFRVKAVTRDEENCTGCKQCDRLCPMNIEVSKDQVVRNHQCISCLECTSKVACPVENTVKMRRPKGITEHIHVNVKNIIVFVASIVILSFFTALITISSSSAGGYDLASIRTTARLDGVYRSGTYIGTSDGFNDGLVVEVTVDDNQIKNIEITENNETIGYYEQAFLQVPYNIVLNQTTDVDTVSGATKSSVGIIEAVYIALEEANVAPGIVIETLEESEDQTEALVEKEQGDSDKVTEIKEVIVAQSADYADGVYTGSATGYGGKLTVEVTTKDGYITNIDIIEENETTLFFRRAKSIVDDIVSFNSTEVDAVTKATDTSEAIIKATEKALKKAK